MRNSIDRVINLFAQSKNKESSLLEILSHILADQSEQQKQHEEIFKDLMNKAILDDAESQFKLGWSYQQGEYTPTNLRKAIRWYYKAAKQGHFKAQMNLGWMYETGQGLPQSKDEAIKWYTLAERNIQY